MKRSPLTLSLNVDTINEEYKEMKRIKREDLTVSQLIDKNLTNNELVFNMANNINKYLNRQSETQMRDAYENLMAENSLSFLGAHRRQFAISEPNNPKYVSYVYINNNKNEIIKVYNYECCNSADYMLIKEIAYQNYAYTLIDKCDFKVSIIKKYGKFKFNGGEGGDKYSYNCIFYIVMEKINYLSLNKALENIGIINEDTEICNKLSQKLTDLDNCLSNNGLNHNDYHSENILVNIENNNIDVALIDYGNADENSDFKLWDYSCQKLIEMSSRSASPVSIPSGGKKTKTRKMKAKTRKMKAKTRKMKTRKTKTFSRNRN